MMIKIRNKKLSEYMDEKNGQDNHNAINERTPSHSFTTTQKTKKHTQQQNVQKHTTNYRKKLME